VDSSTRGPTRARSVSAASDARRIDPFDLSRSRGRGGVTAGSGGGHGAGVRGADRGSVRNGTGKGGGWLRARRDDPYFRRLFAAVDRRIEYPRKLALALEQGQVIVHFRLDARGKAGAIEVIRSSGHPALDREVTRAIAEVGSFGPPPRALSRGGSVGVRMPYRFKSPMVR
jgi:TonB family protein